MSVYKGELITFAIFLSMAIHLPACNQSVGFGGGEVMHQALEPNQSKPLTLAEYSRNDGPSQPVEARWLVSSDASKISDANHDGLALEVRNRSNQQWSVEVRLDFFGLRQEPSYLWIERTVLEPTTSVTLSVDANEIPLQNLAGACQVTAVLHVSREIHEGIVERKYFSPALAYQFEGGYTKMRFLDLDAIHAKNKGRLNGIARENVMVDKLIEKKILQRRRGKLERAGDTPSNIKIGRIRRPNGRLREIFRNDSVREVRQGGHSMGFELGEDIEIGFDTDE